MDTPTPDQPPSEDADPGYREAVVDLLGVLAYGELNGFLRMAADADAAPTLRDKAALGRLAATEFQHYELILARLGGLGADPEVAMAPFIPAIDGFHARTRPSDWLEGLVKAYVGDGIATDFYREVAAYLDESTAQLVRTVLDEGGQAEFAVQAVRAAIERDARVAGRLALWGRRLVGEAISQAQRVAVERDALSSLLVGGIGHGGADLAELGRMFARLTDAHTERMERLGLTP